MADMTNSIYGISKLELALFITLAFIMFLIFFHTHTKAYEEHD